ncbi:hypothetical protein G6F63_014278 [Rhizopus arrhizus]|nr:hypothetical protein G6F63_014278 [Rhizopus arrhizus]
MRVRSASVSARCAGCALATALSASSLTIASTRLAARRASIRLTTQTRSASTSRPASTMATQMPICRASASP